MILIAVVVLGWKGNTMRMCRTARKKNLCVSVMSTANVGLTMQCVSADEERLISVRCAMYRLCTCTQKACMLESISWWKVLTSPALTACVNTINVSLLCVPREQQARRNKAVLKCSWLSMQHCRHCCTDSTGNSETYSDKVHLLVDLVGAFAFMSLP